MLDPGLSTAQANRGKAYQENKDIWNAYQDYSEVIMCPGEISTEGLIELLFRRASLQYDSSLENDAYSEVIRLDRKNIEAYKARGHNLMLENDFAGARADFDMVVKLSPRDPASLISRAEFLYRISELKDAIADWRKTLEIDPNNEIAKGNLRHRLQDEEDKLNKFFPGGNEGEKLDFWHVKRAIKFEVFLFPIEKKKQLILKNINDRKVDFSLTSSTETELTKAGADDEVIQAIRRSN